MKPPPQTQIGFRSFFFLTFQSIFLIHSKKVLNQTENTGFVAVLFALRSTNKQLCISEIKHEHELKQNLIF